MSRNINGTSGGELPAKWQMKRLGDIAKVATGGTPSRENAAYWNGSIPWITTSLIDFGVITSAEEFITPEAVANSAAKVFPQGTLLMAMFGQGVTRGKVAVLGIDAAFNQACVGITPLPVADPTYLFQFLFFKYKSIRNLANSGSQENLNAGLIKGIEVNVPPLAEQQAIAAVLSAWDRAIGQTTALIAAKQRLKQGLMQKLLSGTKRFKGSTTNWITCHIGDLLTEMRRYVTVEDDTSYRLVSVRRNSGGMFDREPRPGRDIGYSKLMTVEAGDFLIARRQVIHGAMTIVPSGFTVPMSLTHTQFSFRSQAFNSTCPFSTSCHKLPGCTTRHSDAATASQSKRWSFTWNGSFAKG